MITLDLNETDAVEREARRQQLEEPYRTVLGHLRHEIAHYYQPILAPEGSPAREACRRVFGDDTLQTAVAYGLRVDGPQVAITDSAPLRSDPRAPARDLEGLLDAWLLLTYALNAINRSMGAEDLYPFVLPPVVQDKLAFIDGCVRATATSGSSGTVSA